MSVKDIDIFRQELPNAFKDRPLPETWDDLIILPIDDPESFTPTGLKNADEGMFTILDENDGIDYWETWGSAGDATNIDWSPPRFPDKFPGAPRSPNDPSLIDSNGQKQWKTVAPDCLAFYLPFHFYHPDWWGIYLIAEGVRELASYLRWATNRKLQTSDAVTIARLFLYRHESFHHSVECFATRLEVVQRTPLYSSTFRALYKRTFGTDACSEEALANAHAIRSTCSAAKKHPLAKEIHKALLKYVEDGPPGYRRGGWIVSSTSFLEERAKFAEWNHNAALPSVSHGKSAIWNVAPHAFTGIGRITSRVNYVVSRNSSLGKRLQVDARYVKCRKVTKLLAERSCQKIRNGKGSHQIWCGPSGKPVSVPVHPGDMHRGLLHGILKQLGLQISMDEFLANTR